MSSRDMPMIYKDELVVPPDLKRLASQSANTQVVQGEGEPICPQDQASHRLWH